MYEAETGHSSSHVVTSSTPPHRDDHTDPSLDQRSRVYPSFPSCEQEGCICMFDPITCGVRYARGQKIFSKDYWQPRSSHGMTLIVNHNNGHVPGRGRLICSRKRFSRNRELQRGYTVQYSTAREHQKKKAAFS